MASLIASIRLAGATMLVCVVGYTLLILCVTPAVLHTAQGSLITGSDGKVVGSRLIAQKFEQPRYFWARPSAAGKNGYDAASASGSNKSPTSEDLTKRAKDIVARHGATADRPLPAELAAASGGGLDPHISERAARYQARRVADARGLPLARVETAIEEQAFSPGGVLTPDRLINVLELNLALDRLGQAK
jgi:K+-transporting ATPase ATPase C chain